MKSLPLRLLYFSAYVLLLLPGATCAQTKPRLTLQDLLSIDPIGETALSPDGKTIAIVRGGQILLMPATGGWPATLTSILGGKSGLAWSPSGKQLAYASQGGIWVVPVAGGPPSRLTNAPAGGGDPRQAADRAPLWSPNGKRILFESGRRGANELCSSNAPMLSLRSVGR